MGASVDTVTPTRRTVVRSAAWSVPAVAASMGAPAFAASPCATSYPWRLDWNGASTSYPAAPTTNAQGVRTTTATITGPVGTSPMTVTFSSSVVGDDTRTNANLRVDAGSYPDVGGTGGTGLLLQHQNIVAGRANSRQQVDITFGRSVSNLRFTITDIDSNDQFGNSNDFYDHVELSGVRTGVPTNRPGGTYVIGSGVQGDAWRMYSQDLVALDNGSPNGNVAVTYSGAVQAITLVYYTSRGSGNQAIFLSDLTFDALGC